MANTLAGGPWDYLPVLNECIKIMITILIGFLAGRFKAVDAQTFVPQAVKFVFKIALPFHIMRGIGIVTDFYDDKYIWTYISAFLVLRVIALVVSVAMVILKLGGNQTGIGQVAVNWLCLSWISTVILGVPIMEAVFGNESLGLKYGLFAGISSFIFQLPFQLFLLECHLFEREFLALENANAPQVDIEADSNQDSPVPEQESTNVEANSNLDSFMPEQAVQEDSIKNTVGTPSQANKNECTSNEKGRVLYLWVDFARRRDVWIPIAKQVFTNPIVCGIAMGFFLSLTTIGPKYLKPTSPQFVPGLFFIWDTAAWLGACVSPVCLVAMGVWMEKQGRSLFNLSPAAASIYMFSKLFVVPLLMVGLAKAFDFNDEAGRAAILIAALPISMASFSLGSNYDIGQNVLSANVAIGTLLMLPTILLWNIAMDAVDLYPIPDAQ